MRSLITKTLAGVALLACFAVATPQDADAQVQIRGGRNWDRSGYWNNYWNWYDGSYRPYYNRGYRNSYYGSRYGGSPYYGSGYRGWDNRGWDRGVNRGWGGGYRSGVQIGDFGVYWR